MSETDVWDSLNGCMGNLWHAQRHEDSISPDIPDVSFTLNAVSGWIELKQSPTCSTRPRMIPKLRPGQINWMHARCLKGGKCWIGWLLVDTFLLIPAPSVDAFDMRLTPSEWHDLATGKSILSDKRSCQKMLLNALK